LILILFIIAILSFVIANSLPKQLRPESVNQNINPAIDGSHKIGTQSELPQLPMTQKLK
jgi:hypothetical protein